MHNSEAIVFKALADDTRLRILRLLSLEELNVWELGSILDLPQPTISRHLAILRSHSLVIDRRDGNRVFYRVGELRPPFDKFAEYLESLPNHEPTDLIRLEECLARRAVGSRRFADDKAAEWDELAKSFQRQPLQLFAMAGLLGRKELTLADLGTGTGLLLPFLAASAGQVYAVDQSVAMLRRARQRCARNQIDNVHFIHSRLEKLSGRLPPCDGMLLHFVLHQVARPAGLLRALGKELKPGGRLVIADRIKHDDQAISEKYGSLWHGFECEQLESWLKPGGLRMVEWRLLPGSENHQDQLPGFVLIAEKTELQSSIA